MSAPDLSALPVTRDQIEIAMKYFLASQEPGTEISVVHPDGTSKHEIQVTVAGGDNIQMFLLHLAVAVTADNSSTPDDREAITDTFYGYATKIKDTEGKPGFFTFTVAFEPDLFTALMSDPSLGFI